MGKKTFSKNIDSNLLDSWLGRDNARMLHLTTGAGLSLLTVEQMRNGRYKSRPKRFTRDCMTKVTGIPEEQLFPFVAAERALISS